MNAIGVVSPEQMHALWQDYQTRQQLQPHSQHNYPQRRHVIESTQRNRVAVIGTALAAPASSLVEAESCTIYFLDLQTDGTKLLDETEYTAYNDDPDVTAEVGTYCRVEWLDGRWMIYYLGCEPQDDLIAEIP